MPIGRSDLRDHWNLGIDPIPNLVELRRHGIKLWSSIPLKTSTAWRRGYEGGKTPGGDCIAAV
jgi:hypothetical protein